jgi:hypothetical protein
VEENQACRLIIRLCPATAGLRRDLPLSDYGAARKTARFFVVLLAPKGAEAVLEKLQMKAQITSRQASQPLQTIFTIAPTATTRTPP